MKVNRSVVGMGLALVALLVVACIVIATRPAEQLDPTTPAGVVQRYIANVMAGDHDLAAQHFADDTMCDAGDLDRAYINRDVRVDLLDSTITGSRARVRVALSTPTDDFIRNTWTEERTIRLEKIDGQWRLTGIPWPLYECGAWLS